MNYRERFRKYVDGTLEGEERARIEEDLEKTQVLLDYLDSSMDEELFSAEDESAGEGAVERPGA